MSLYLLNDEAFLNGGVSEQDLVKAKEFAEKGEAEAQYHLALMLDTGRGVEHNPQEARRWYLAAAEQGHASAQYFLGRMYEAQTSGIEQNDVEAMRCFKAAAEQGHADAKAKIGH